MTGIFITATGTAIGKTHFLCSLLAHDHLHLQKFSASKPIITGWPRFNKEIQHTDTARILAAQKLACHEDNIHGISPWRFYPPLTPAMAIQQENTHFDFQEVVNFSQQLVQKARTEDKIHFIEGVGGLMAPIHHTQTVLDWIDAIATPCIVLTGSYLGALSHSLTAITTLQTRQIPIIALIVNETLTSEVPLTDTCKCLAALLPTVKIIALPHPSKGPAFEEVIGRIYQEILENFLLSYQMSFRIG